VSQAGRPLDKRVADPAVHFGSKKKLQVSPVVKIENANIRQAYQVAFCSTEDIHEYAEVQKMQYVAENS
jgi:hypothetical protein